MPGGDDPSRLTLFDALYFSKLLGRTYKEPDEIAFYLGFEGVNSFQWGFH